MVGSRGRRGLKRHRSHAVRSSRGARSLVRETCAGSGLRAVRRDDGSGGCSQRVTRSSSTGRWHAGLERTDRTSGPSGPSTPSRARTTRIARTVAVDLVPEARRVSSASFRRLAARQVRTRLVPHVNTSIARPSRARLHSERARASTRSSPAAHTRCVSLRPARARCVEHASFAERAAHAARPSS